MSTHEESIAHTNLAIDDCDEINRTLSGGDSTFAALEGRIQAAFVNTQTSDEILPLFVQARERVTAAQQAVVQLQDALRAALLRFQGGGAG